MKTTGNISAAEMLAALDEAASAQIPDNPDDGARTAQEWAEFWGINKHDASRRIQAGLKAGLMEKVHRRRMTLNNQNRLTLCYLWVGGQDK